MSAPRPYVTDPFRPLGSTSVIRQFLYIYIYKSVLVISFMWYVLAGVGIVYMCMRSSRNTHHDHFKV